MWMSDLGFYFAHVSVNFQSLFISWRNLYSYLVLGLVLECILLFDLTIYFCIEFWIVKLWIWLFVCIPLNYCMFLLLYVQQINLCKYALQSFYFSKFMFWFVNGLIEVLRFQWHAYAYIGWTSTRISKSHVIWWRLKGLYL